MKYCARCKDEVHKEQKDEYFRSNSSEMKLRGLVYRHADTINIGDIV